MEGYREPSKAFFTFHVCTVLTPSLAGLYPGDGLYSHLDHPGHLSTRRRHGGWRSLPRLLATAHVRLQEHVELFT